MRNIGICLGCYTRGWILPMIMTRIGVVGVRRGVARGTTVGMGS